MGAFGLVDRYALAPVRRALFSASRLAASSASLVCSSTAFAHRLIDAVAQVARAAPMITIIWLMRGDSFSARSFQSIGYYLFRKIDMPTPSRGNSTLAMRARMASIV